MNRTDLLTAARDVARNAYSPYSSFSVGAAVLFTGSTSPYTGCNVENLSYGLTICAERNAIFAGIAAGKREIEKIAVSSFYKSGILLPNFVPCGACLQVIKEFAKPDTPIIVDGRGDYILAELLPIPFA